MVVSLPQDDTYFMIEKIIDLHIHSRYSRACSPLLELLNIAKYCQIKGIDIVATGDFTHPAWFQHIKENLAEIKDTGLYRLKNSDIPVKFILSTEISCIYRHLDKTRRLHLVLLAPNIAAVEELIIALEKKGVNLRADGRPIMGLSAQEIMRITQEIDKRFFVIPAHAWTPWFAVFGSKSGYDSLEECFGEFTSLITAIETGLSSDPPMNRRLSVLDNITLVSNSDAHSLDNLGREANVLSFNNEAEINYDKIAEIIKTGDKKQFLYTIEFYPEEGMYHFDGHRDCAVCFSPKQTKQNKFICPHCQKNLTVGVLHRVEDLADREEQDINWDKFVPHRYVVPLKEIIAKVIGVGVKSKKVEDEYSRLIKNIGSEFNILLRAPAEEIKKYSDYKNLALAIDNTRAGKVKISPGFDGQYGAVEVLGDSTARHNGQGRLFG